MADPVQRALRRKLEAAKAIGDVERIKVIRGLMGLSAEAPVEAPAEAPPEAPAIDEADNAKVERWVPFPSTRESGDTWLERNE